MRALQTAVVAGADSALGLACCELLLAAGCRHLVALCDTPAGAQRVRTLATSAHIEVPAEALDTVAGVARALDLLRQRAPWDAIVLVSSLREPAAQTAAGGDGAALRAQLRREIEAPLLIAQAAWELAPAQQGQAQLWLVPPHAAGGLAGAAAAAACAGFIAGLEAAPGAGAGAAALRVGCLSGDDAAVLASLRAALSRVPAAAAR